MDIRQNTQIKPTIETVLALIIFAFLAIYTYAKFFALPYAGFVFDTTSGKIRLVFTETLSDESLIQGDLLIQVGEKHYQDYINDLLLPFFEKEKPGDVVQITVQRAGQNTVIPWTLPGWNQAEFLDRFNSVLILAYIFWAAGVITIILIRPRDLRWRMMIAFFLSTSSWLTAGSLSAWHIWGSAILVRALVWLWVPIALHLHWVFPKPFRRLPTSVAITGYALGILLALLQVFQLIPASYYFFGFIVAAFGSLMLLVAHFILQPGERHGLGFLVVATATALLPPVVITLGGLAGSIPTTMLLGFLAMPMLPTGYFIAAFRQQLGGLELRINRAISSYFYVILLGLVATLLIPAAYSRVNFPGGDSFVAISAILLAAIFTTTFYPVFVHYFERRFLGIPLPQTNFVETYADRITTSLGKTSLVQLIKDEILPSLLVRQSTLIRIQDENRVIPIYTAGLQKNQLPKPEEISSLLAEAGIYRPPSPNDEDAQSLGWIRLILPLKIEDNLIGLWLLGRRDPDDYYPSGDIDVLKVIANQTAIALVNIMQADRLLALHHANIERHEKERFALARELHDGVLGQLAVLSMQTTSTDSPEYEEIFQLVTSRLRSMVTNLRPAMLQYGLSYALEECVDELSMQLEECPSITLNVPRSEARFESNVEEHIYRIVQQACENAIRHAHATQIRVYGNLDPENVHLTVEDDGVGFDPDKLNINTLLSEKHFGLAGMFERADLIGGNLKFNSTPGEGTRIHISWHLEEKDG